MTKLSILLISLLAAPAYALDYKCCDFEPGTLFSCTRDYLGIGHLNSGRTFTSDTEAASTCRSRNFGGYKLQGQKENEAIDLRDSSAGPNGHQSYRFKNLICSGTKPTNFTFNGDFNGWGTTDTIAIFYEDGEISSIRKITKGFGISHVQKAAFSGGKVTLAEYIGPETDPKGLDRTGTSVESNLKGYTISQLLSHYQVNNEQFQEVTKCCSDTSCKQSYSSKLDSPNESAPAPSSKNDGN